MESGSARCDFASGGVTAGGAERSGAFRSLTLLRDEITGTCSDWSIAFGTLFGITCVAVIW